MRLIAAAGADIGSRVAGSATIVAVFLALVTIFALHLSDRLQAQLARSGGAQPAALRSVGVLAGGSFLLTATAVLAMAPSAWAVLAGWGGDGWQPELLVYDVTWVALLALAAWLVRIAWRALRVR